MLSRKFSLVIAGVMVSTLIALAAGTMNTRVILPNAATVKAVRLEIYSDSECTNRVTSVDWGIVEPGATENVTVYIRNEGNVPVSLFLRTENWSPPNASDFISLTWDYGVQAIDLHRVVQMTLSLSVSDTIEGITTFNFDIVVIGIG